MPQPSPVQIIQSVGKAIGRHRKETDRRFDALEGLISASVTIDRMLSLVQRGLDALLEEAKLDGLDADAYCQQRYQEPLDRCFAEYHFLRQQKTFQVQPDKLRSMLMQSVEKIVGEPVVRGRMLRGRIDPTRIAASYRGDPDAILETSSVHLLLIGKGEKLRSYAEGLADQPLGDPRALWFKSLLDQAGALGADSERVRALTKRFHLVRETLEVAASRWEAKAELYRNMHRKCQRALKSKSDDALPECSDVHRAYFAEFDQSGEDEDGEHYEAQSYKFRYLGVDDAD